MRRVCLVATGRLRRDFLHRGFLEATAICGRTHRVPGSKSVAQVGSGIQSWHLDRSLILAIDPDRAIDRQPTVAQHKWSKDGELSEASLQVKFRDHLIRVEVVASVVKLETMTWQVIAAASVSILWTPPI